MKFAQCSAVYFNYSLQYCIQDLADLGYDAIEIWGGRPHMYRDDLDEQLDEINGLLQKNNMEVCNFIPAQFRYPSILASPVEKIRKNSVAYIKTAVDNAVKVNAPTVHLCAGMTLMDHDVKQGWQLLKKSFQEIEEYAREKGKLLMIEPAHKYESNLILTIDDGLRMIDELKSDIVGILLDTGHAHVNGENFLEIIPKCKGIPFHIHLDDNDGSGDQHKIPGEGTVDFKSFVQALKEIDFQGVVSAELGGAYIMDPRTACQTSLERMREMFGER